MDEQQPALREEAVQRERPYKPDMIRVERGEWKRASGACICTVCGEEFFDHSPVVGYTWLTRLCNGNLVKL